MQIRVTEVLGSVTHALQHVDCHRVGVEREALAPEHVNPEGPSRVQQIPFRFESTQ